MANKIVLSLLLLSFISISSVYSEAVKRYDGYKVIRVTPKTESQFKYLEDLRMNDLELDFWKFLADGTADIMIPPHRNLTFEKSLLQKNFFIQTFIDDVGKLAAAETVAPLGKSSRIGFTSYYRYADIQSDLKAIAAANPTIARAAVVGKSYGGRDIDVLLIGTSVGSSTKPIIVVDCGIHAREWIAVAFCTYFYTTLINNYKANNADAVQLMTKYEFHVMPCTNPDGYEYSHTNDRMWRKTRRPNTDAGSTCIGTDPNRNWSYQYGGTGTSTNPCAETYRGPRAFSEPECKAVSDYLLARSGRIKNYNAVHSYGQYWLFPWGYANVQTPDHNDLNARSKVACDALRAHSNTPYTYGTSTAVLYAAAGAQDDWAYGTCKAKYSYTLELPDRGTYGFQLPASQIARVGGETYAAVIAHSKAMEF